MSMLRRFIRVLRDIAYPKICLGCKGRLDAQSPEEYICSRCRLKIKKNVPPFCHSCGRHLEKDNRNKNICSACLKTKLHFDRAFSPCLYEGVLKELIHEFKYKGKAHLAGPLSRMMADFIREYDFPIDYMDFIVPIPLHKAREREREFNQAEALSRHIAAEFNKGLKSSLLIRTRPTETQTGLANERRFLNMRESFRVAKDTDLKDKNVLIVDDVLTTGATSSAAAAALKGAGANIVFVLTLAN
ncbi:MAG: ComF family protein [Candidatus Omnitrophica bacterium]|nr:ComF family protein [Candidatus Omnitrophota bacterium]